MISAEARKPCADLLPPLPLFAPPNRPNEIDYQAFGLVAVGAMPVCDGRRRLAVAEADFADEKRDFYQSQLRPRRWWQRVPKAKPFETTIDEILAKTP